MSAEILGVAASCVVLISFLVKGEKDIRIINILGAGLFVVYGVLIKSFSTAFLNGALICVHLYKLIKKKV
ncbi:MAG: YgjV family protein [Bacteroidales bacterium]|nr:YgjV family protein [Candidatus Scybalousia scybalohippi]